MHSRLLFFCLPSIVLFALLSPVAPLCFSKIQLLPFTSIPHSECCIPNSEFRIPNAPKRRAECPLWGFYGHRKINRHAVFSLPPEMVPFFKKNIDWLTDHAIDPDMRRYASTHEAPRHYLDLDRYGKPPFPDLPRNWGEALMRYSDFFFVDVKGDTLRLLEDDSTGKLAIEVGFVKLNPALFSGTPVRQTASAFLPFFRQQFLPKLYDEFWAISPDSLAAWLGTDSLRCTAVFAVDDFSPHGILPYHLERALTHLADAFREKDSQKILRLAADLGHYLADAHVPLHTTENYNGQLSGQDGIHAFWESRLPELFAEDAYDFWVGKAGIIEQPRDWFWGIVLGSHSLVDSVLSIEREVASSFSADQQFCNEMRGERLVKTQCEVFAAAYHKRLGSMVEDRLRASILAVSSAWYTAWVMAGQPDLQVLMGEVPEPSADEELEQSDKSGTAKGRAHDN
jgi:hypothetical protein